MCDGHGIVLITEESFLEIWWGRRVRSCYSQELKVQMDQLDAGSTEVGGFLDGHLSLSWQRFVIRLK